MYQVASYDRSFYNNLPGVEEVDCLVRASGKLEIALATLAPIFVQYNMCDKWGLSILHSHWFVDANEVPIQEVARGLTGSEFVTMPRTVPFPKTLQPSLFAVAGEKLQPLEFSTDNCAAEANVALGNNPNFAREFCTTLSSLGLASEFGLVLIREPEDDKSELVEFNRDGISVLSSVPSMEVERGNLIQTSWRFRLDAVGASCQASCFQTCTKTDSGHTKNPHTKLHKPG